MFHISPHFLCFPPILSHPRTFAPSALGWPKAILQLPGRTLRGEYGHTMKHKGRTSNMMHTAKLPKPWHRLPSHVSKCILPVVFHCQTTAKSVSSLVFPPVSMLSFSCHNFCSSRENLPTAITKCQEVIRQPLRFATVLERDMMYTLNIIKQKHHICVNLTSFSNDTIWPYSLYRLFWFNTSYELFFFRMLGFPTAELGFLKA